VTISFLLADVWVVLFVATNVVAAAVIIIISE
jgi:hypothetical protein